MNERIAKLMDQAGELAYEEHKAKCLKNGLDPMMPFGNNLMAILEKFAELIVAECMRMCDVAAIGYDSHGHTKEGNGCAMAREYIKEHFGVEE